MKQITPGTGVPAILAEAPSVMSKITAVRDAGPGDGTPATVVFPSSLQRSNIQFFLRSIAKSPRPK
jgi:hypothetical protein